MCFNRSKVIGMVSKTVRIFGVGIDRSLFIGVLGGCVCSFIDIDHFIALAAGIEYGRFLHPYYLVISIAIIGGCCTYIGGLLLAKVLRRNKYA